MQTPARSVQWEKFHIFISSTFNDMHAERDFLVKKVFSHLSEWCERRKLRMVYIDLRWGVTEEDATRNRNVVKVCLDRIDECRPFFLCFLGQRYGWVPRRKDVSEKTLQKFPGLEQAVDDQHSLTELEVLHALVRPFHSPERSDDVGRRPAEHAFFFVRDASYIRDLPTDPVALRRTYTDEAETDPRKRDFLLQKNMRLKETVSQSGRPVISYQAKWSDGARSPELAIPLKCPAILDENIDRWRRQWKKAAGIHVSAMDAGEDPAGETKAKEFNEKITRGRLINFKSDGLPLETVILRRLKEAISERFPDHVEPEEADDFQRELYQQERFLFVNSEVFVERYDDFSELDDYVKSGSRKLFVLTATAGMGKTTLLANWIDRHRRHG